MLQKLPKLCRKEALSSIKEQSPRLVKIQPGIDTPEQSGVKNYKMTSVRFQNLTIDLYTVIIGADKKASSKKGEEIIRRF